MFCLRKERHNFFRPERKLNSRSARQRRIVRYWLGWDRVRWTPFIFVSALLMKPINIWLFQNYSNISQDASCVQNNAFTFTFLANSMRYISPTPPYWEYFVVSFIKTGKRFLGNVLFSLYFIMASEFSRIQLRQNEVKVTIFFIFLQLTFFHQLF